MKTPVKTRIDFGARSNARQLALQALYQWQINEVDFTVLEAQFSQDKDYKKSDKDYFSSILQTVMQETDSLDAELVEFMNRPLEQLDPVAHAVLWIGLHELKDRIELPYKVVLNEAVKLTKRFGPVDSHKFINAVLDNAAKKFRALETGHNKKSS